MVLKLRNPKRVLGSSLLGLLLVVATPALAMQAPASFQQMSDAELNEALQGWSTLASAKRRELLVEIKQRMERPQQTQAGVLGAKKQIPGITVHIRIQQTRQFGVNAASGSNHVRTGGMLVIRGPFSPKVENVAGAPMALPPTPQLVGLRRLKGPDFGRGFEQRQAFLQTVGTDHPDSEMATEGRSKASASAPASDRKEAAQSEQ